MTAKRTTPPLVRLAHPMAFMAVLRNIGTPVDTYLRRHRLPVLCDDPDALVPIPNVWSFFHSAAQHEDPSLGWLAGAYVGDHTLNAGLLDKLETAPTLLQALRRLVRLVRSEATDVDIGIRERREDVLLYTRYPGLRDTPGYVVSQAYQLHVLLDLTRGFIGRLWFPREIGIEDSVVPITATEHFPGSRIRTQQPMGYIAIPRSSLHHAPCRTTSIHGEGDDAVLNGGLDYVDTLRAVLRAYLPDGYPSATFTAELMDTSVRTLARTLAARDLTYSTLIDELRFEVAKKHLQEPTLRIVDVAQSVGFKDQGDFARMFRRISGMSPKEFRRVCKHSTLGDSAARI